MKRVLCVLFVLALLASGSPTLAQDPTPEPGANASKMLPSGAWIGKGWKRTELRGVDADANLFREAAVASYGGPQGSRVVIFVFLQTDSREAVRQSWEAVSSSFDTYKYRLGYGYERDQQLQTIAAPEGCAEAKRAEGEDQAFLVPTAITMCGADPDIIILVIVSGPIGGVADYTISDWIASQTATGKQIDIPIEPTPAA
jgi:hypothetical protein